MGEILSIRQLADLWTGNGGDPAHVNVAVQVALAESGGDAGAVSATGDYGLWQINLANLARLGVAPFDAFVPSVNVKIAIRLSSNGTDWGDWCTCFANPGRDCGRHPLPLPQPGSAADLKALVVDGVLNPPQVDTGLPPDGNNTNAAHTAWGQFVAYVRDGVPAAWSGLNDVYNALGRVFPR